MTAQQPDILIYEGERLPLFSNPLESYFSAEHPRPNFNSMNTANWRGYVATWQIEDGRLYLADLQAWLFEKDPEGKQRRREVGIHEIFPASQNKIFASWFTGWLRAPRGQQLQYIHMGYSSIYEQDLLIEILRGHVVQTQVRDNRTNK